MVTPTRPERFPVCLFPCPVESIGRLIPISLAGDYTLVVSPFEPRHLGKFALHLECSDRFDITPIQQEGAGMFTKPVIRGQW